MNTNLSYQLWQEGVKASEGNEFDTWNPARYSPADALANLMIEASMNPNHYDQMGPRSAFTFDRIRDRVKPSEWDAFTDRLEAFHQARGNEEWDARKDMPSRPTSGSW